LELLNADIQFAPGKGISTFAIRNAGGEDMMWTAVGVPDSLILNKRAGTLTPGETVSVLVTVKFESLPPGPFVLSFSISANDTAKPVTLTGTKE